MSNELATRTQGIVLRTVDDVARIAQMMAGSGYFKDAREAHQAGVKIMAGQGWGIQPFDAMNGIHVINGKPAVGAGLMAAKVKGSGKYDYRVRQMTPEVCEIEFFQGEESIGTSTFTIAEAKAAGTQNLTKFPRNMLFARAMSNGVKWFCPDVFSSPVYVAEELGAEVDEHGHVIDVQVSAPRQAEAATEVPEPEQPAEVEAPAEPFITGNQMKALQAAITAFGFGKDDEGRAKGRAITSWLAGRAEPVASAKDLLMSEAAAVLDILGSDDGGSYRADQSKVDAAKDAWLEHLDLQSNPLPDFDPNAQRSKPRKGMQPIGEDETPASSEQEPF